MSAKIDFKIKLKHLYQPSTTSVSIVDVPGMQFLMVDGQGDPNTCLEFKETYSILYPVAYKLKFMSKAKGKDYVVSPPEALWWADDMNDFIKGNKNKWKWTSMIMVPDFITKEMVEEAIEFTKNKKPELLSAMSKLHFRVLKEGTAAQIMHIGPYSEETENIAKIHAFIKDQGGRFDGHEQKHHEIYLSDPRRTSPNKMKTVVRQPFVYV